MFSIFKFNLKMMLSCVYNEIIAPHCLSLNSMVIKSIISIFFAVFIVNDIEFGLYERILIFIAIHCLINRIFVPFLDLLNYNIA